MLNITGTEAIFANLAHFSTLALQIAFTSIVFHYLLLQYLGLDTYILHHQDDVIESFYRSIPDIYYYPMFVISTITTVISIEATIFATLSIIKQSVALGFFPKVKVLHTSKYLSRQICIPKINWILMVLCCRNSKFVLTLDVLFQSF
jgi:KUP system potassium uptake protein